MWPTGFGTASMGPQDSSCWLIFHSAQTIPIWRSFPLKLPCRSAIHFFMPTPKYVCLSRGSQRHGSRFRPRMKHEGGRMKPASFDQHLACSLRRFQCFLILVISLFAFACALEQERRNIPPEVEAAIGTVSEDIAAERYEKIYNEASELWRQDATLEQSVSTFRTLRTKLGAVENRTLQSATEQENSSGPLKGR